MYYFMRERERCSTTELHPAQTNIIMVQIIMRCMHVCVCVVCCVLCVVY